MQDIVKSIIIDAPISHVWAFLSEQQKFEKWMLSMSGAPELGETFYFRMEPAPDSDWDGEIKCRVTAMDAPTKLEFTWSHNQIAFAETRVAITLKELEGATEVTLVHSGWDAITDAELRERRQGEHDAGWDNHLTIWNELATGASDQGWMDRGHEC